MSDQALYLLNLMTTGETIRARTSVRHYSDQAVSDQLIKEILEEASWAPSAGNMQPWRITVLGEESSKRFRKKYEFMGWESVLPTLRMVMLSHNPSNKSSVEINEDVLKTFHQHAASSGSPRVIVIYYNKRTWKELLQLSSAALSLYSFRMKSVKSIGKKAGSFFHMAIRSIRDIKVAKDTINASLAGFTYAITLCAKARGLDSCIQFSYNHVYPWLRKDLGLSKGQELFGIVLIGHKEKTVVVEGVNSRTRKPVDIEWNNNL